MSAAVGGGKGKPACGQCGKAVSKPQRCSKCKRVYYCDVDCQRSAWPQHKRVCGADPKPATAVAAVPAAASSAVPPLRSPIPLAPLPTRKAFQPATAAAAAAALLSGASASSAASSIAPAPAGPVSGGASVASTAWSAPLKELKELKAVPKGEHYRIPLDPLWLPPALRTFQYVSCAEAHGVAPQSAAAQHPDTNLMVLLHGTGDSEAPYVSMFRAMKLPQTAALALRGPEPLPLGMGFGWFTAFDAQTCEPIAGDRAPHTDRRRTDSLNETRFVLMELLRVLVERCRWPLQRLFLFGFSHGAVAAVDAAAHFSARLGGVIAVSSTLLDEHFIGAKTLAAMAAVVATKTHFAKPAAPAPAPAATAGATPTAATPTATAATTAEAVTQTVTEAAAEVGAEAAAEAAAEASGAALAEAIRTETARMLQTAGYAFDLHRTPLLVTHGAEDQRVPLSKAVAHFEFLRAHNPPGSAMAFKTVSGKGHAMVKGPDEARAVLTFLSEHLHLRALGLERQAGVMEVTPQTANGASASVIPSAAR